MAKTLYLGIDEAGYGPNIGPLAIGCVAFHGPATLRKKDWWEVLGSGIGRQPQPERFVIDDSKKVLARPDGWRHLSDTVHSCLAALGRQWRDIDEIFRFLAERDLDELVAEHWYSNPWGEFADFSDVEARFEGLLATLKSARLELRNVRARVVFPRTFNRRLSVLENKAEVERELIVELLRDQLQGTEENVVVYVDRLGGRRYYRELVEDVAENVFPQTIEEGPRQSIYRFELGGRTVEIRFCVEADALYLPVALASMFAKYLRERAMEGFNAFWAGRVPGLRPTAGYPGDAQRFLDEIRPALAELAIPIDDFWRRR